MSEETPSRWKTFVEMLDTGTEKAIDAALDHIGCTLFSLFGVIALVIVFAIGLTFYDEYIHRNQHCIHATREYVWVGKVLTPEDVCDTWGNN